MSPSFRKIITFVLSTFILNLIWELGQGQFGLYANYGGDIASILGCTIAALGDVVIVSAIYSVMTLIYRTQTWIWHMNCARWAILVITSFLAALVIEHWGLQSGRWSYSELMPIIPLFNIGLMPILQMVLLVPIITLIIKNTNRSL